jgi:hypothetical protein
VIPSDLTIYNEPCDCQEGVCMACVEPPSECINRLTGEVVTRHCEVCDPGGSGSTWHQDGQCLRCLKEALPC